MYAALEDVKNGFATAGVKIRDLEKQVEAQKSDVRLLVEKLHALSKHVASLIGNGLYSAAADGHIKTCWQNEMQAKEFGEIVLAAMGRTKDLSTAVPYEGGYLVPEQLRSRIITLMERHGRFRANATTINLDTNKAKVPQIVTDLAVYCPGEGREFQASDMKFSQVDLSPRTWGCLTAVSNELADDSVAAVGEIIGLSMARSMAKQEDRVGFCGDGTSTYFGQKGIIGSLLSVAEDPEDIAGVHVGPNTFAELQLSDFRDTAGLLPSDYDQDAKWYINKKTFFNVVYPLLDAGGVNWWTFASLAANRDDKNPLAYPVEFTSVLPYDTENQAGQVIAILGDLRIGAYLADRKRLTIEQSRDFLFKNYQTALMGVERVDFNVFGVGDTEKAGPIVMLMTGSE